MSKGMSPAVLWWLDNTPDGRRFQRRALPESALMPRARAEAREEREAEERRRNVVKVAEYLFRQDVPRQARAVAKYAGMREIDAREALDTLARVGKARKTRDGLWEVKR
jgi:hypothetical protein